MEGVKRVFKLLSKTLGSSFGLWMNFLVISHLCRPETPQLAQKNVQEVCCVPACVSQVLNTRETLLCNKNWWCKKILKPENIGENSPLPMHGCTQRVGGLPAAACGGDLQAGLPTGSRKLLAEVPQGRSCLGARRASKLFSGLTGSPLCSRQPRCLMNHSAELCFKMQGCFSWDISIPGKYQGVFLQKKAVLSDEVWPTFLLSHSYKSELNTGDLFFSYF